MINVDVKEFEMSIFGDHLKDDIVISIRDYIESESDRGREISEILSSVLEAVTYGIAN